MRILEGVGLLVAVLVIAGCETTNTSGKGNQEAKRLAAIERQKQQAPMDEGHTNLWRAQQDRLDRDGNPSREY
jgi:hypothetical protein